MDVAVRLARPHERMILQERVDGMARSVKRDRVVAGRGRSAQVAVVGELFDEAEGEILKSLLELDPESAVELYIDSAGGSVYAALAIATVLRLRRLRATAIVVGECSSSAILIFAACPKRLVTPRSVFLFHRVKWRSEKDVRSDEAVNWASHFEWLEEAVDRFQAELLGSSADRFTDWIERGRFVLGTELVEMGLAELIEV